MLYTDDRDSSGRSDTPDQQTAAKKLFFSIVSSSVLVCVYSVCVWIKKEQCELEEEKKKDTA